MLLVANYGAVIVFVHTACLTESTWFLPRVMNEIFKGCLASLTLLAL